MDTIENLGDAHEALDECFKLIFELAGGDTGKVSAACKKLRVVDPWGDEHGHDPKQPMRLGGDDAL